MWKNCKLSEILWASVPWERAIRIPLVFICHSSPTPACISLCLFFPTLRDASDWSLSFLWQSPPREGSQGELTPANSQTRMSTNMWRLDQMPLLGKYTGPLPHLRPPFRNQLFPCWREKNHNLKTLFKLGRRYLLSVLKTSTPCCSNEKEKR